MPSISKYNRGSISVKGTTYRRLQILCAKEEINISKFIEEMIEKDLDEKECQKKTNKDLILWEVFLREKKFYVASDEGLQAANYLVAAIHCPIEDLKVKKSNLDYNPGSLIPGVLVPDEERSLLASI